MYLIAAVVLTCFLINNGRSIIIRNDISDRCLHIGLLGRNNKESLYATSCTWNTAEGTGTQSHPHENLKIISADEVEKDIGQENSKLFHIQKVTNSATTNACLATINNQPGVSHECSTSETSFLLDIVEQNNFKGVLTTKLSFKIRNNAGKCLAVQPGTPFLHFKDCQPQKGLFQVWSICRHNRKCDVDFAWTPSGITFPENGTNIQTENDNITASTHQKNLPLPSSVLESNIKIYGSENTFVNEILYTVQNAAKIYGNSEQYLVNGIAAFYTVESVSEAKLELLKICYKETIKCDPCTQCTDAQSSSNMIVAWLMKWMTECNSSPHSKMFLSKDVFQIPHHLFPSPDPSYLQAMPLAEKYKQIIPNLKKYLKELETKLHDHENGNTATSNSQEELNGSNLNSANVFDKTPDSVKIVTDDTNSSSDNQTANATQDYASIIDIRLFNG